MKVIAPPPAGTGEGRGDSDSNEFDSTASKRIALATNAALHAGGRLHRVGHGLGTWLLILLRVVAP